MYNNGDLPNRAMLPDAGPVRFGSGATPTFSTLPNNLPCSIDIIRACRKKNV